ncbi:MAG: MlaD family protein [Holophagales bacterium]|nr:MlaD family protein [Holophagales bacterium]
MSLERSSVRVGMLVLLALSALLLGIFLIGEQNNLFRPMNRYTVRFANVSGLQAGNPVQLSGVDVGRVVEIVLPESPTDDLLEVQIAVDRRYAQRIRRDSMARIQTLGLLGDKYISLTSGTEEAVVVPHGGEVEAAPATDVDRLIASGENAVENIVAISASLARLLDRMEKGDSVLGQLVAPLPEDWDDQDVFGTIYRALDGIDELTQALREGKSPLARLLVDERMGARLDSSIARLERILAAAEEGDGLLPALLNDDALHTDVRATVANLRATSEELTALVDQIEVGDGLLPRLLDDEAFAEEVLGKLGSIVDRLDRLSLEIAEGDGTVSRLIHDPQVYEAINDVIVGVNQSRLLRWLIRNRQKAGIEKRYEETREDEPADRGGTRGEHP